MDKSINKMPEEFLTPEVYFRDSTKSDFFKTVNDELRKEYDKNPIDSYAQQQAEDWLVWAT
jgi:hypothetical protein